MNDKEFEKEKLRWEKEFVYEQWRKMLTYLLVGDINTNLFEPSEVTSEKIRTVFNLGYKLALLQSKRSLMLEMAISDEKSLTLIEKLMDQIDDRFETQKCFIRYKKDYDESLLMDAIKREEEFKDYLNWDMTKWANRYM